MTMFPSIDNISGLKVAKSVLDARKDQFPTINIKHYNKHSLQSYGAAQDPHVSCSYSDITVYYFNVKVLECTSESLAKDLGIIFSSFHMRLRRICDSDEIV